MTPDRDVFLEVLALDDQGDFEAAYLQPPGGGRPSSIPPEDTLYMFSRKPTAVQLADFHERANELFKVVRAVLVHRHRVLPAGPAASRPTPVPPAGTPGLKPPHCLSSKTAPTHVWVAAVDSRGYVRGDVVSDDAGKPPEGTSTLDDRGLMHDYDKHLMLIQRIEKGRLIG